MTRERCRNVSPAEGCFVCSRCGACFDAYLWAESAGQWTWTLLDGAGNKACVRFCPLCGAEVTE